MRTEYETKWFESWLKTLRTTGTNGFESVRSLHVPFFDCFNQSRHGPINGDIGLVQDCPGLTDVRLGFHVTRRTYFSSMPYALGNGAL